MKNLFIQCTYKESKTENLQAQHVHNSYELYFLTDGQIDMFVENRKHQLNPFDIILIRPNSLHNVLLNKECKHKRIVIHFDKSAVYDELIKEINQQKGVVSLPHTAAQKIYELINLLLSENENDLYHDSYVKSILNEILILILRNTTIKSQSGGRAKFEKIIDYVKKSKCESVTLALTAQKFNLSEAHLSREFKKHTGFTFTQYVNYQRIIYSKKLLLTTDNSIKNVALQSGFENLTHFERVFKQITKCSPREYKIKYTTEI